LSGELFVTFVHDNSPIDLVVPLIDGTGEDLYRAALDRYGSNIANILTLERTGLELRRDAALRDLGVFTGDRILVGWKPSTGHARSGHWLTVIEGPEKGRVIDLENGTIELGRGADGPGRIGLADKTVSRRHASFLVGPDEVRIRDLGSSNGSHLNGARLDTEALLSSGDVLRFGDTSARVERAPSPDDLHHLTRGTGRISFNREPRVLTPDPASSFQIPDPPHTPQRRKFPLPAAVLPVVMGLAIFVLMGSPYFLLLAGVGPVMVIWTTVDDRRSGRNEFTRDSEKFNADLAELRQSLDATAATRREWLENRYPSTASLVSRAKVHDRALWRRRVRDDDFTSLRVGTGSIQSATRIQAPRSGDPDLVASAERLVEEFALERSAPIPISLVEHPVVGVVQAEESLSPLVRSLVAQLICDQSPKDVALAVIAPQHGKDWEFAKWLPHVQSLGSDTRLIADGDDQAKELFQALNQLVQKRFDAADESIGSGRGQFTPHLVVVVHPPAKLSRREVTGFLERAPKVGVSVLWISTDRTSLPGECSAVIDQTGGTTILTFTNSGVSVHPDSPEWIDVQTMETVSRSLAPLDDVSSGSDSVIPSRVDLLDLLGMPEIGAREVLDSWATPRKGLSALIGADAEGGVEVDWRLDGPHALVAGTTGAGKSELLQSLVASMSVIHPPSRLTFVLIDYKGGAAFKDCNELPHTVGMVTDLDDHLAERALISLGAELKHREHLLDSVSCKDIIEMSEKAPDLAPPNMIIIIDEFAALRSEVPDFVDGVIDIAQRGRSLGVHLLLATQQPSGVIDPKIQGNTNLRIALRVADSSDSVDVIGRADANQISKSLPGRGYLRTGPSDVNEFQSAYVGGSDEGEEDMGAVTFKFGLEDRARLQKVMRGEVDTSTDLQRLVAAVREAAGAGGYPPPRLPWVDPLSESVLYDSLVSTPVNIELGAVLGMADHPDRQTQTPFVLDFNEHANWVVFGSSGAGKTTLVRTLATDLALRNSADRLWMYVLDYGSRGLSSLEKLPHCGGVIFSDDLNRTRRLLDILTRTAGERRQTLGEVNAAGPAEYESITGRVMPRILVFVDGFGQLWETLDGLDHSQHLATVSSLFAEGRSVGIHFVVTADRRQAIPTNVTSAISGRLIMRMAERDEYLSFGLPGLSKSKPPANGRAFTPDGLELQVGVLRFGDSTAATAQSRAVIEVGSRLKQPSNPVLKPDLLPEYVHVRELCPAQDLVVPVGLDETRLATVSLDLTDSPTFVVFGPDRSGRSTMLGAISSSLRPAVSRVYLFTGRRSPLDDLGFWDRSASGLAQAVEAIKPLKELFDRRVESGGSDGPVLVVIDDGDEFGDGPVGNALDAMVKRARDANFVFVSSMTVFAGHKSYSTWIRSMRANRHGMLLQPDLEDDGDLFGIRLPRRSGLDLPPGRGFLVTRIQVQLIQAASY